MTPLQRAQELVQKLEAEGIRASTDPAVLSPPGVLFSPPNLAWDVACGYTASWQLVALAPAALTADRTSWQTLDELVEAVAGVLDLTDGTLISYVLNGTTYPAYLLTFTEAL
jgi:hypothetical protein